MRRAALRFACVYAILYLFPFPLSVFLPDLEIRVWRHLTDAVGSALGAALGIQTPAPYYVGDAAVMQLYVAFALVVSIVVAGAWAWLDRAGHWDAKAADALRSYLRFALAVNLINYGAMKVVPAQFPPLGLDTLYQPIGDASPMGLLWAFMGASQVYVVFTGGLEVLAGVMLGFRATALPGALLATVALTQILALNLAYDVPQKQFTVHLLLMAAWIIAPEARRLVAVVAGHGVEARPARQALFETPVARRVATLAGVAFIVAASALAFRDAIGTANSVGGAGPRSPMRGVWEVREFSLADGATSGPAVRWRRLIFDSPERAGFELEDGEYIRVLAKFDPDAPRLRLYQEIDRNVPAEIAQLVLDRQSPDAVSVSGTFEGHEVHAALRRVEPRTFLLNTRGFRWFSESEFIR